ncbi:unnamed protein product [Allacma fusca]|uniref:BHLH domain-containing protein n=1 Tax=Allacma fusca TaxID=39272 RepID=A0A8J2PTI5_9HEXA|nr:unnamed protein product [Allacma fusca]
MGGSARKKLGVMPRKKKSSSENHRLASVSSVSINKDKPIQRNAANARERARMRVLSRAFCRLKTTLPWVPADTKLSKLDTLRLAASYIAHLKGILREDHFSTDDSVHPAMNLTWPFGFNRGGGNGSGGGGSGSEDAESGSSCAWEEVTKDCVHLEQEDDPSLHLHLDSHLHHLNPSNVLPYGQHHHQQTHAPNSMIPSCFHDDIIVSIG